MTKMKQNQRTGSPRESCIQESAEPRRKKGLLLKEDNREQWSANTKKAKVDSKGKYCKRVAEERNDAADSERDGNFINTFKLTEFVIKITIFPAVQN